jgi:hypothetical protein
VAYAGRYKTDGDKLIQYPEVSWNRSARRERRSGAVDCANRRGLRSRINMPFLEIEISIPAVAVVRMPPLCKSVHWQGDGRNARLGTSEMSVFPE